MRSLILLAVAMLVGCGSPSVDVPTGNDKSTSDTAAAADLPAPSVQASPGSWPYGIIALRGNAGMASRVLVEGAGNPTVADVQPLDGTFCIAVELAAAPAHYELTIRSQADDGRLSAATVVEVDRANDAPAPTGAQACDGSPIGN
jgi:hypothetical protein